MSDPEHNTDQHTRRIRSFVRREGRLTPGQQRALDELWPRYGLASDTSLVAADAFGRSAPLTLEIGFGNGASLATMATQDPDSNYVGIEVHRPGVGHLLKQIETEGLENVRIYCHDAVEILHHCIDDHSLDRVLLFFPDPWHKKRHHKRRIVQPDFIELLAGKIRHGGRLHMATDWEDYAQHMVEVMSGSTAFRNCAASGAFVPRPEYRPVTKFEQRGQRLGHGVWDLLYERV